MDSLDNHTTLYAPARAAGRRVARADWPRVAHVEAVMAAANRAYDARPGGEHADRNAWVFYFCDAWMHEVMRLSGEGPAAFRRGRA